MNVLDPGSFRGPALDDETLLAAMLRVEAAWLSALAADGAADPDAASAVAAVTAPSQLDPRAVEDAGNPVPALLTWLRGQVDTDVAAAVHRGLTSQDVLDTALMLLARGVLSGLSADLRTTAEELGRLAGRHRATVMAGRTLTQHAVPVTFGLVAAQWLVAVLDAADDIERVGAALPVQCGGAAGTLALAAELVPDPVAAAQRLARTLGLVWPGLPWHTRRTPVTRLGDALVQACDAVGVVAADVLTLGRPEIGEVSEGASVGRGGSSTMPHKRNPVLAVLIRSAALQAPLLGAQLHQCAALATDQRPDGAWHAEWAALRRLLQIAAGAASQTAELVQHLEVHDDVMAARAALVGEDLLAERGGSTANPSEYLGATTRFVDEALARLRDGSGSVEA